MNFSMPTMKKLVMVTFAVAALSSTTMLPTTLQATTTATFDASAYKAKCASCHGMDGNANTAKGKELKVRAFSSAEVKGMSDQKLLEVILKGKGKMQGYEKSLGKEKCQALVAYCRSLAK
jgi:cytochrome c553